MEKSPEIQPSENSCTEPEEEKPEKMTWRQIKILASVIYGNFFLGCCYSLMAPFFPAEAERKQTSPTSYGFVFGIYQLVMFAASPVYGKLIPKLTSAFLMKTGMFVSGVCVMMFGLMESAPPGIAFIVLACLIRFVDALGASAFLTSSYTTLGSELPKKIGKAMAYTETAFASGLAFGPVIGGGLFHVGGFWLPFVVIGALLFLGVGVNMILFSSEKNDLPPQKVSAIQLLSNIDFFLDVIAICTCFAGLGFNEATLEPHIRQFKLSSVTTGGIFLICGLMDALSSPGWGVLADLVPNSQYLTFVGTLLFIGSFLIVGPVSIMSFPASIPVVVASQLMLGLGMGAEIVCSFEHGMNICSPENKSSVERKSLVSGILFSAACLGAFIGPTLGGYMIDHIGYVHATEAVVIMKCIVAFICLTRFLVTFGKKRLMKQDKQNGKKNSESKA